MRTISPLLLCSFLFFSCTKDPVPAPAPPNSTLSNGLIAYYAFTGNAIDSTSNHNDGVASGSTLTSDRHGNANRAYAFNGVSDYIKINNSTSLDLKESFSISAWIKPDNYKNPGIVLWHGDKVFAKDPFILYFSGLAGASSLGVRRDAGSGTTINETNLPFNVIFSNVWCHVVGSCNAQTKQMKLYVNGEFMGTKSFTDMSIGYSTTNFYSMIGAAEGAFGIESFYKGKLDEIRIYDRELTQNEVSELSKL